MLLPAFLQLGYRLLQFSLLHSFATYLHYNVRIVQDVVKNEVSKSVVIGRVIFLLRTGKYGVPVRSLVEKRESGTGNRGRGGGGGGHYSL